MTEPMDPTSRSAPDDATESGGEAAAAFDARLLDYDVPEELIAQRPAVRREDARLLIVNRANRTWKDTTIRDLPGRLRAGDLLVLNDTRVLPARFSVQRATGGRLSALFLEEIEPGLWEVMLRGAGRLKRGETLRIVVPAAAESARRDSIERPSVSNEARDAAVSAGPDPSDGASEDAAAAGGLIDLTVEAVEPRGGGHWLLRLPRPTSPEELLSCVGTTPLPPYIRRPEGATSSEETSEEEESASEESARREAAGSETGAPGRGFDPAEDEARYQTVFAREPGSVAAPTAGLHLSDALLAEIQRRGVEVAFVTLHVGVGTFQPLRSERLEEHIMHVERYELPEATAEAITRCRARGGRVVAVGTTAVRTLETCASPEHDGHVVPGRGTTSLFIYPPYQLRVVDALLTNFHWPRSTLLALVMAFADVELIQEAYRHAIANGYRLFSFGDAMFLE
jgi:S-adenosylmethionine:tRNA ribosyltransferase-isomerase